LPEMLFKIKEIGDDGVSLNLPVTAAWLLAECPDLDAVPAAGGLKVRGQLLATGDDVFLRGHLRGALEATCSRCLEKARVPVDVPLTVTFRPTNEGQDAVDDEDDEDELDVASYDGDEVDLAPEIRDQILLTFPIKPLCREDCVGLCSVCGGNRNQVKCDCEERQAANRLPMATVLGKLKM
jgi:uncharacterized protein